MPFADADGVKLYYEDTGQGEPVLFVHEFSGDYRSWEPQVRYLSRKYRCVTFNARGYPPSDVPRDPASYSQPRAVEDIVAIMDHLDIERAHIVGISMGGFSTLHLGLGHPERAISLVVTACGYGVTPQPGGYGKWQAEADAFAVAMEQGDVDENWRTHAHAPGRAPFKLKDPRGWEEFYAQLSDHPPAAAAHTLRGVQKDRPNLYELDDELRKLTVPTLIVNGDEDEPCLEPGIFLKRTIPSAALCVLPKTGHTVNLEEPAFFNRLIEDFFDTVHLSRWQLRDTNSRPSDVMGHSASNAGSDL